MSEVAASALLVRLGIAAEAQVATFKPNGCPARPCLEPEAPFGCASTPETERSSASFLCVPAGIFGRGHADDDRSVLCGMPAAMLMEVVARGRLGRRSDVESRRPGRR